MKKHIFFSLLCALTAFCVLCGCFIPVSIQSASNSSISSENSSLESSSSISSSTDSKESSLEESSKESSSSSTNKTDSSESSSIKESSSSEKNSSKDSSIESSLENSSNEDSSEDNSGTTHVPPDNLPEDDLATGGHVGSRAPENYGTNNTQTLQSEVVSDNSSKALMGTFNTVNAPVYQGYMIWTWAEFRLGDHFGEAQNLTSSAFSYDVKTENCGIYSSIILVSPNGSRTVEIGYVLSAPSADGASITITPLDNGWSRICIDLSTVFFDEPIVENVSEILIMFTNQDCADPDTDSIFYIDNAKLIDVEHSDEKSDIPVYNPDGYYQKTQPLNIKIVGNSFVSPYTSNCAYYLQLLCNMLGANVSVDYLSIPNGRIPDQYASAFGAGGYMQYEQINVLFIQDFYSDSDMVVLGDFLTELYTMSPTTELKVYAGENETSDGIRAAAYYGVDLVNWRKAIKTLKANYGFTAVHLNAGDGWHPNELSGFVGALMMYMELYGETPDFEIVKNLVQEIWYSFPGIDDTGRTESLHIIYELATSLVLDN